jgi:hypothetical protein
LGERVIIDILGYLEAINAKAGKEKGFSLIMFENGGEVFNDLDKVGGYSGIMIKSPHYIGLAITSEDPENEFNGAYYMQSIVKKLYDMKLGSCWINIRDIAQDKKQKLLKNNAGNMNYLLAFGQIDEKAVKQKAPQMTVKSEDSSYKQNPYGTSISETAASDKSRHSVGEIVYMYEWGKMATYEELESRGMGEIFFYVRNAPSYKNLQPCRLILKDGEAELTVLNPKAEGSYVDAGIMMYTLDGLAKDMGIPGKWNFVRDESSNKEYSIVAKIEL